MTTTNTVDLHIDDRGVATVTLDRVDKHNAFDQYMISKMIVAFTQCSNDPQIRLLLLKSKGKHFSAGADLAWMKNSVNSSYAENFQDAEQLSQLLSLLHGLPFPTLVRVQGSAFGGALGLICACDIAIATENACFCLSEVKLGLVPAVISPYVIAALGKRQAQRYMLTAEAIDAPTAKQMGIIHELRAAETIDEFCDATIDNLLKNGPEALKAVKLLTRKVIAPPSSDVIHECVALIAKIRTSAEGQEGLAAFLEKRKPGWL